MCTSIVCESGDWRRRNTKDVLPALTHSPSSACMNMNGQTNCRRNSWRLFSVSPTVYLSSHTHYINPYSIYSIFQNICPVSLGLLYTIQFHSLCQHTRGSSLASISLMRNGRCSFWWAEGRSLNVLSSVLACDFCLDALERNIPISANTCSRPAVVCHICSDCFKV